MMFEGKHIHFSPVDNKPLCSYSGKLCKQRRLNGYAFCIRHILEDNSAPFKQCAHVARYNNQKCTNPIPANEDREFCNSHMQVAGMLPKRERKLKKEKDKDLTMPTDGKLKFADRLRALLRKEGCALSLDDPTSSDDPYAFPDPCLEKNDSQNFFQPRLVCSNNSSNNNNNNNNINNNNNNSNNNNNNHNNSSSSSNLNMVNLDVNIDSGTEGKGLSGLKNEQIVGALPQTAILPTLVQSASQVNNVSAKSNNIIDGKPKTHVPKFTKTMNRLQAKIAQNKLLDKLKKSQESSHNNVNHSGLKSSSTGNNSNTCMVDGSLTVSTMEVQNNQLSQLGINQDLRIQESASSVNGNVKQIIPHSNKEVVFSSKPSLQIPVTVKTIPIKRILEQPIVEGSKPFVSPKVSNPVLKVCSLDNKTMFPAPLPVTNRSAVSTNVATVVNCGVSAMLLSKALSDKKERTVQTKPKVEKKATHPSTPLLVVKLPTPDLPPPLLSNTSTVSVPKQCTPAKSHKQDALRLMVQQARRFCCEEKNKQRDDDDFFYGFVCSESEESELEEDCSTLHRLNWCSSLVQDATANAATSYNKTKSSSYCSPYSRSSVRSSHCQVPKGVTRASQLCSLKDDLRRYSQLSQKLLLLERQSLRHRLKDAQSYIEAVRIHPEHAAQMLITKPLPSRAKKRFSSRELEKTTCCHQLEGFSCRDVALPYTKHCIKHITYNVDQLLFEHCTAKFADNTQCCVPVFDVSHELPLCWEHAKKRRESYTKLSSEPKPKKARKKTKPSALTRPPKRGKKKKKPSSTNGSTPAIRPETPPATATAPATAAAAPPPPPPPPPPPKQQPLLGCTSETLSIETRATVEGSMVTLVENVVPAATSVVSVVPVNAMEEIQAPVIATVPVLAKEVPDGLSQDYVTPVSEENLHTLKEVVVPVKSAIQANGNSSAVITSSVITTTTTTATTISENNCGINTTSTNETNSSSGNNMENVISSDLVNNYLPGVQELPLDTAELANQASKLLEEHDFTEVLNKIPDDAFSDLFSDGRNGEYIPTKEETEELERALAAVSKDVLSAKESLAKLTVTRQDIEELSNTIDISAAAVRLLGATPENLTVPTLDENALSELAAAHSSLEPLNVITSDLNSFTQAFTAGLPRGNETLAAAASRHRCQQQQQQQQQQEQHHHSVVANTHHHNHHLLTSNVLVGHHLTNGDSECLIHPQVTEYALGTQFLDSAITSGYTTGVGSVSLMGDSLLPSASNVASIISTHQPIVTSASPTVTFNQHHSVVDIVAGNGDDSTASLSSAVSSQWLLNPSLALTQLGYQNGFQVGPSVVSQPSIVSSSPQFLSNLGKFPLQTLSAELSLISSNHSGHGGSEEVTYEDSLLCSMLKESVQQAYGVRPPPVQDTKPTILAQDGAS